MAAHLMQKIVSGFQPVGEDNKLVGMTRPGGQHQS